MGCTTNTWLSRGGSVIGHLPVLLSGEMDLHILLCPELLLTILALVRAELVMDEEVMSLEVLPLVERLATPALMVAGAGAFVLADAVGPLAGSGISRARGDRASGDGRKCRERDGGLHTTGVERGEDWVWVGTVERGHDRGVDRRSGRG